MTTAARTVARTAASPAKPLRRDAERNRQLILAVAGQVFAEHGLEASFDEIARRAGVGVGTVYRRFPDREDLVDALFVQRISMVIAQAEQAVAMPDAWAALAWFIERGVEMQAADRGLKQVLASSDHGREKMAAVREDLGPLIEVIVTRAQQSGALRLDIDVLDIAAVTSLLSTLGTRREPELWRRYVTLLLDGLRASRTSGTALPLTPPDEADLAELARAEGPHPAR